VTQYGEFSKNGDEYIIYRPDTPKPWVNILTNGQYCAHVSHTGGGYSFVEDSLHHRITRKSLATPSRKTDPAATFISATTIRMSFGA